MSFHDIAPLDAAFDQSWMMPAQILACIHTNCTNQNRQVKLASGCQRRLDREGEDVGLNAVPAIDFGLSQVVKDAPDVAVRVFDEVSAASVDRLGLADDPRQNKLAKQLGPHELRTQTCLWVSEPYN